MLSALFVYFGWSRTQALFGYFGVPSDALGYSAQQLVLRSIVSTFQPFLILATLIVVVETIRLVVLPRYKPAGRAAVIVVRAIAGTTLTVGTLAVLDVIRIPTRWPVVPGLLLVGVIAGQASLRDRRGRPSALGRSQAIRGGAWALIAVLVFWFVGNYATYRGVRGAEAIVSDPGRLDHVVVTSPTPLPLSGPGVLERTTTASATISGAADTGVAASGNVSGAASGTAPTATTGTTTLWEYSGLRVLAVGDDAYFLLPDAWTPKQGSVLVLRKDSDVSLSFRR